MGVEMNKADKTNFKIFNSQGYPKSKSKSNNCKHRKFC